jgi:signal peptidase I
MTDAVPPVLRRGAGFALGLVAGLAVAVLAVSALSSVERMPVRVLKVLSGSMTPAIRTGDAVVVRGVTPSAVRVGDVVTFRDPLDSSRLITHRVRGMRFSGETASFVTRGDANNTSEHWSVPLHGRVGLVRRRLPKAGYAMEGLQSPPGRLLLIVVPALVLCAIELRRVWVPEPPLGQLSLF